MNPRFPPIDKIQKNLTHQRGPLMEACLAGALTSYYGIVCNEFEHLRALAQAAVDGDIDDRERLAKYLAQVDGTAELYATSDTIALPA